MSYKSFDKYGFMTRAAHAGWKSAHGRSVSLLEYRDSSAVTSLCVEGGRTEAVGLETALCSLDGGAGALTFASPEELYFSLASALCTPGTNVIISQKAGAALGFFQNTLSSFGIEARVVDSDHPCQTEQAVNEGTRAIITSTIGGTLLNVAPIEALSRVAKRQGVPFIIDNSAATPALCRPIERGAHIVIYSSMKQLSGNGNLRGAALVEGKGFDWEEWRENFPAAAARAASGDISPLVSSIRDCGSHFSRSGLTAAEASALHASLATLALRMERQSENALAAARFLEQSPEAAWVSYPGLSGHPQNDMAQLYLKDGCGPFVAFGLKGGAEAEKAFSGALSFVSADKLSSSEHQSPEEIRPAYGLHWHAPEHTGGLRLSIGLEDESDIIDDIAAALEAVEKHR